MQYQLCPKCQGQGTVSKQPGVPGDVMVWASSATSFVCDVCHGAKILTVSKVIEEQIVKKIADKATFRVIQSNWPMDKVTKYIINRYKEELKRNKELGVEG